MPKTSTGKTALYVKGDITDASSVKWNEINKNLYKTIQPNDIRAIRQIVNLAANKNNYTAGNIRLEDNENLEMHNFMHHTVAADSPQNTTSFIRTGAIDFTSNEDVNKQMRYRDGVSTINSGLFAIYGKQLENELFFPTKKQLPKHRLYKYDPYSDYTNPLNEALSFTHKWNNTEKTNGMSSFYFSPYNIEKARHKAFNKLDGNQRDWLGGELDKVFSLNANLEYDDQTRSFYLNSVYPIKKY